MKLEKHFIVFIPILLFIMATLSYIMIINNNDTIKFKNEYEKLNQKYYSVSINKNLKIKYSSYKEVFDIINSKTGIIYLGYPTDDNSRFAINTLLNVIENNNVDTTIYYLDIHQDRDSYTIEDDKLVYSKDSKGKEIKGVDNYFKLLDMLDEYLDEYIIYVDDKEYKVGEKRIHFPTIIFISEGKIKGLEYASLDMDKDSLYSVYEDYISNMYSSSCDSKIPC